MVLYKKKEKNLTELEKKTTEYGDAWVHAAFDPNNKVVVSLEVGKRTKESADKLIKDVKDRTDDTIPFFTSDKHKPYKDAILENYGIEEKVERTGKPGRPRKPRKHPPPELKYAQVVKHRREGKLVRVETKVVFGLEEKVQQMLEKSTVSNQINTSFVERQNLTLREENGRLSRKSLKFSKEIEILTLQLGLFLGYYHFVRPHLGLRIEINNGKRRWLQRTPMMSAGITNRIWTLRELITFHIPIIKEEI